MGLAPTKRVLDAIKGDTLFIRLKLRHDIDQEFAQDLQLSNLRNFEPAKAHQVSEESQRRLSTSHKSEGQLWRPRTARP